MRVFKTKTVARYTRREHITYALLTNAIERGTRGLVDADLGGGIVKQRVARAGEGRSGGHRMLIAYRLGQRAVFLYGFGKSEKDNIDPDELLTLREIGEKWLGTDAGMLERALHEKILMEVFDDREKT